MIKEKLKQTSKYQESDSGKEEVEFEEQEYSEDEEGELEMEEGELEMEEGESEIEYSGDIEESDSEGSEAPDLVPVAKEKE